MAGSWAGYLEYRDYSEPATSTKRVQLPTWVNVTPKGKGFSADYIYDDGPNKVVTSREEVALDAVRATYEITNEDKRVSTYRVEGLETLKSGLGTLVLSGSGEDGGQPAELRITLRIRRNMIEWLEEVRPQKSSEAFAFRHILRLTRTDPPTTGKTN